MTAQSPLGNESHSPTTQNESGSHFLYDEGINKERLRLLGTRNPQFIRIQAFAV